MPTPTRLQQPFNILPDLNDESIVGAWFNSRTSGKLSNYVGTTPDATITDLFWTPAKLNSAYWWDASDTSTIIEGAGKVSSWEDKNQGVNIIQTNAVNQPTTNTRTINGLNTLDFDGSTSR